MQNSASTMIALITAAVLLFIIPLVTLADRKDNVTQENVKLIVEKFVIEVTNTGKLTRNQYQNFKNELSSTGNTTFEIDLTIQHLDENPGKKTAQANYTKIGENVYYSEYTSQILKQIGIKVDEESVNEEDDTILLKEGDLVYVDVKNENSTTAQTLKSSFLGFSNAGEYVISANSSGMVTVNGAE